jgi:CDP-glucose 4,6-dehydratase
LFEAVGLPGRVARDHRLDVRDLEGVRGALAGARPEVVFHLAAQPLVLAGVREPVGTFASNVMGTVNLLEAVRSSPSVRAVVVVTTDKCYRDQDGAPCAEDAPLGGADPYSASKACAELVAAAYRASFLAEARVGVATARAGNVIGGGDMAADRLVPDLVRAALGGGGGRPVVLRYPHAVRPWQHVLDALAGYLLLAERLAGDPAGWAGGWNFGPDETVDGWTVGRVARELLRALGGGAPRPSSTPRRRRTTRSPCCASRRRGPASGWAGGRCCRCPRRSPGRRRATAACSGAALAPAGAETGSTSRSAATRPGRS